MHAYKYRIVGERTMAEDSSNDASIVAITSDEDDDKPIKKLFKRLMTNDRKQLTILTNNQILDLFKVEFNINIYKLHNLEVDIYITLLKKYLKDWPLWEEFDIMVNDAKKLNKLDGLDTMLQSKYKHLKAYLQQAIDIAEPLSREAALKLKSSFKVTSDSTDTPQPVVMEIDCTRSQLNCLFSRAPTLYTVFNVNNQKSTIIVPGFRNIESILNWWNFKIEVVVKHSNVNLLIYKRETNHELKHCLINKLLPINRKIEKIKLNQELYVKNSKKSVVIEKRQCIDLMSSFEIDTDSREMLEFIKNDIQLLPETLYCNASYKRYMNGCAYVRYLYKDQDGVNDMDLQLEEKVFPMCKVFIGDVLKRPVKFDSESIRVECGMCKVTFTGVNLMSDLRSHFEEHCTEPDWVCTNCNVKFPMLQLTGQWWAHRCVKKSGA